MINNHLIQYLGRAMLITAVFAALPTKAQGVAAGSVIINTATVHYEVSGIQSMLTSRNELIVAELIDVSIFSENKMKSITPSQRDVLLRFTVVNTGNGEEAYQLFFENSNESDFSIEEVSIYIDDDEQAGFSPSSDRMLYQGEILKKIDLGAIILDANEKTNKSQVDVFVVFDVPGQLADKDISLLNLLAQSQSLISVEDNKFDVPAKDNGVDLVLGESNGMATAQAGLQIQNVVLSINKVVVNESQNGYKKGDIVSFSLDIKIAGTGTIEQLVITDPLPEQLQYVANSLSVKINNSEKMKQTDTQDKDLGKADVSNITVDFGDITVTNNSLFPNLYQAQIFFDTQVK